MNKRRRWKAKARRTRCRAWQLLRCMLGDPTQFRTKSWQVVLRDLKETP